MSSPSSVLGIRTSRVRTLIELNQREHPTNNSFRTHISCHSEASVLTIRLYIGFRMQSLCSIVSSLHQLVSTTANACYCRCHNRWWNCCFYCYCYCNLLHLLLPLLLLATYCCCHSYWWYCCFYCYCYCYLLHLLLLLILLLLATTAIATDDTAVSIAIVTAIYYTCYYYWHCLLLLMS